MDACIDGYYMLGPGMSIKKRSNLVKVMKSAISISKSHTGDTVCRVNKQENRAMKHDLLAVRRMRTYNQITLDHSTRLFERKKRTLIQFHNSHSVPEPIRLMQNRYDELKEQIKSRQVSMWNNASDAGTQLPELSSALTERLRLREPHPREPHPKELHPRVPHPRENHPKELNPNEPHPREPHPKEFHTREFHAAENNHSRQPNPKGSQPREPHRKEPLPIVTQSLPSLHGRTERRRTEVVTRESVRRRAAAGNGQPKQPAELPPSTGKPGWCDMERIDEFLLNQTQQQEAMYFKLHLDRWNTMMDEKEKAMREKYPGAENHLYSVALSKRLHGGSISDRKSDVTRFYSRNSNHTMFQQPLQSKSVDYSVLERKTERRISPRKNVRGKCSTRREKIRGIDRNKSVTFLD